MAALSEVWISTRFPQKGIGMNLEEKVKELITTVSDDLNADIVIYNGDLDRPLEYSLIKDCGEKKEKDNVFLILVTFGGSADCAYRVAKCFQNNYKKFTLCVPGLCKSAGTLVALGAHEIVFGEYGELGPLDVQMSKKDDIWERQSGLTVLDTLTALRKRCFTAFENIFLDIQLKSGNTITTVTAAEIASGLAVGLFSNIYDQIDPLHIGEVIRAMTVAQEYGDRLMQSSQNLDDETLQKFISGYPSHNFVIDFDEGKELFNNARRLHDSEVELLNIFEKLTEWPINDIGSFIFLSNEGSDQVDIIAEASGTDVEEPKPSVDGRSTSSEIEEDPGNDGRSKTPRRGNRKTPESTPKEGLSKSVDT